MTEHTIGYFSLQETHVGSVGQHAQSIIVKKSIILRLNAEWILPFVQRIIIRSTDIELYIVFPLLKKRNVPWNS